MNHNTLLYNRGLIVDNFIHIELMINTIISAHFLERVDTNFIVSVLNNEMSSFGFKKSVLKQIIDIEECGNELEGLEKLNRIRNLFAHASLILNKGVNMQDTSAEVWFSDPKKVGRNIDPEGQLNNFNQLHTIVWGWLIKIAKEKGVQIP